MGICGVILVPPALAQYSSVIEGTVSDQSGAPVPNAKIVVTNQATNVSYPGVSTTSTGTFRIPALPLGVTDPSAGARLQVWTQRTSCLNQTRSGPSIRTQARRADRQRLGPGQGTAVETSKTEAARTVGTTSISDAPIP